jgi:catechol 2,3-dioxygenase-like lactoylglutathione lyase family enzyme
MDAAVAMLKAQGIEITGGPNRYPGGAQGVFFRDPDRNVIELRGRDEDLSAIDGVVHYTP